MNIENKAVFPYGYSETTESQDVDHKEINELIKRALVIIEPKMRDSIGSECFSHAFSINMAVFISAYRERSSLWKLKIFVAGEYSFKEINNIRIK